jgi:formate dehydrogenase major subunit
VVSSDRVRARELFTSFHFPDTDVNSLLSSSADESSKCPEYKVSTVQVEPADKVTLDPQDDAEQRQISNKGRARL